MKSKNVSKTQKPHITPDTPKNAADNIGIAIMAAGKGTRLKSRHPKVLHRVGGKALLEHVIAAASRVVAPSHIYVIIGHEAESVRAAVQYTGVNFVVQAPQRGTGHAIMVARENLEKYDGFLVLSGDVPLIRTETIEKLRDFHLKQRAAMTILSAIPDDATGYGRIIRRSQKGKAAVEVKAIVEHKSAKKKQLKIREINSGIYAFESKPLFAHLDQLSTDNPHAEYYLTDMAEILVESRERVVAVPADDANEVLGANTRAELSQLDSFMRARKCSELMDSGVTIYKPETCLIDSDVMIGPDTTIDPFVQIMGNTQIGAEAHVQSYSVIKNCEIGAGVTVRHGCIMQDSRVADKAILGPYSHLRPQSDIGEGAHVGNFVETKKTKLGKGSKANHLTYLGDAVIGAGVNVGAGTITCNYDGVNKHQTTIDDGAFIGSDTTLVAPVKVGRGAYVGAASCVTEDVPADSLAIGRARQVNKQDWAKQKREEMAAAKARH